MADLRWRVKTHKGYNKSVKVCVLKPFIMAKTNGGEISLIERLLWLRSKAYEVKIHIALSETFRPHIAPFLKSLGTPLVNEKLYRVEGLDCLLHLRPHLDADRPESQPYFEALFTEILRQENPDLIWTHYTDFFATTSALKFDSDRTWVDMTDNEFPRLEKLNEFSEIAKPYRNIRHFMVASSFMQEKVRESFPEAQIHYLPNRIDFLNRPRPQGRSPEYWVFVNPVPEKGVDFVLELARLLPQESFCFVGNWTGQVPEGLPKNVKFIPRQADLSEVFSKAKGLLMPSRWEEAFGRVPLEAMACGVPVISSDRGGLRNTVGSGGQVLPLDLEIWRDAMQKLSASEEKWVQAGFERVKAYQEEVNEAYRKLQLR